MIEFYYFAKRFALTSMSYKTNLGLTLLGLLLAFAQFSFMAQFLASGNSFPLLNQYGGDLLAYLVVGTAFTSIVSVCLGAFPSAVRAEQQMGTLEFLVLGNGRLETVLIFSALINVVQSVVTTWLLFAAVTITFGVAIHVNILGVGVILLLTVICLLGIGLISAGIVIITKVGDPVTWTVASLTALLSGALFPVECLPQALQRVSSMLPMTHALHALRMTLIAGASFKELLPSLMILLAMACVTVPIGILVLRCGFDKARRCGSLAHY